MQHLSASAALSASFYCPPCASNSKHEWERLTPSFSHHRTWHLCTGHFMASSLLSPKTGASGLDPITHMQGGAIKWHIPGNVQARNRYGCSSQKLHSKTHVSSLVHSSNNIGGYAWMRNGGRINQLGLDLIPHDRKPKMIMIWQHDSLFCQVEEFRSGKSGAGMATHTIIRNSGIF